MIIQWLKKHTAGIDEYMHLADCTIRKALRQDGRSVETGRLRIELLPQDDKPEETPQVNQLSLLELLATVGDDEANDVTMDESDAQEEVWDDDKMDEDYDVEGSASDDDASSSIISDD